MNIVVPQWKLKFPTNPIPLLPIPKRENSQPPPILSKDAKPLKTSLVRL